jgi:hypothetical protein
MAWFIVYDTASGIAAQITQQSPSAGELAARGQSVFTVPDGIDPRVGKTWNPTTRTLDDAAPEPVWFDARELNSLMTAAEWGLFKATIDAPLVQFRDYIMMGNGPVNGRNARIAAAFTRMVTLAVLTAPRATAIRDAILARNFA